MASIIEFHQLIAAVKLYAVEIAGLIVFLAILAKMVWHEIEPLFRRTDDK